MVLQTPSQPRLTHPEAITCGDSGYFASGSKEHKDVFALFCKSNKVKTFVFFDFASLWQSGEDWVDISKFFSIAYRKGLTRLVVTQSFQLVFGFYSYHYYDYYIIIIIILF